MKLVAILENGELEEQYQIDDFVTEVCKATSEMYSESGFVRPWIGYLAVEEKTVVGTCAFKSKPVNDRVEIAYFTFPGNENRGLATEMAKQLVATGKKEHPKLTIFAQTLPENNASTKILEKLQFKKARTINHPKDGDVWEWELT